MEAQNLRIGNIVKLVNQSGHIAIVTEIGSHRGEPYVMCKDIPNGIYLHHKGQDLVQGVPLSEDWLIKFGFEKEVLLGENYYTLELNDNKYCDLCIVNGDKNGFIEVTLFPYEEWFRYRYVHELQNLFAALTGRELELKTDV
jgi:hypothetical protein